jgi:hypothetical protein
MGKADDFMLCIKGKLGRKRLMAFVTEYCPGNNVRSAGENETPVLTLSL